jgi:cytochrome c-type biogenesis protein CcmH
MTFWIYAIASAILAVAILGVAMARGRSGAEPSAAYDLRVYRDQLNSVDRDLARGVIGATDADRLRNEISRRILAADAALQTDADSAISQPRLTWAIGGATAVAVIAGSLWIYNGLGTPEYGDMGLKHRLAMSEEAYRNRPPQSAAEAAMPVLPPTDMPDEYKALVEKLRATVANRPNDLEGNSLLAQEEARVGNYIAAYTAQAAVLRIKGDTATGHDHAMMAVMMALAAGEYVSPEAEIHVRAAMALEPENPLSRYYFGLMMAQAARPDRAFALWEPLLREGPVEAPWVIAIINQIEDIAARAGIRYQIPSDLLPQGRAPLPDTDDDLRGPSSEDMQAAGEMTAQDRMQMIQGMVDGLLDRLATEGGSPAEWAQLINALGVLGETDRALAIYNEAQQVFANDSAALAQINAAGAAAGVAQ